VRRVRDEAFVLRTQSLGEADRLVVLLARQEGQVRAVARSARRSRKRFGGALEPLSRIRASWTERPGRELARLEEADLLASVAEVQADPETLYRLAHVAELAEAFSRQGEGDERAFRLLASVVGAVGEGSDPALAARYYELWTLRLSGLLGEARSCAGCGAGLAGLEVRVDPAGGGPWCPGCAGEAAPGAHRIPAGQWGLLLQALREPVSRLPEGVLGREDRALQGFLHRSLTGYTERPLRAHRALEKLDRAARSVRREDRER
jgi:DNA repair protein RecO (recombination protein O)